VIVIGQCCVRTCQALASNDVSSSVETKLALLIAARLTLGRQPGQMTAYDAALAAGSGSSPGCGVDRDTTCVG